jgi:hypothetical protein
MRRTGASTTMKRKSWRTIVVTPLPARQLRGRIFLRRLPRGQLGRGQRGARDPGHKVHKCGFEGLLINIPLCAMCLRVTPDYPGASTVTTARIGQHSRLALDHTLRWTFDGPRFRAPHDNLLPDSTLARGAGQALASRLQPQLTGLTKHRSARPGVAPNEPSPASDFRSACARCAYQLCSHEGEASPASRRQG